MTSESREIRRAARILAAGGIVVFPTETVYGLGADALNADAVRRVFEAKGRPADNPLIVHVDRIERVGLVAAEPSPVALSLFEIFSPGPITVVLPAREDVPRVVTGGLETVAVRIPAHRMALELLAEAGRPVAAPSANRSGRPSPTTVAMARANLGDMPDAYLDGGPCRIGVESTVIAVEAGRIRVLRPGGVSVEDLRSAIPGVEVREAVPDDPGAVASPGTRHRHYTPRARVLVWSGVQELGALVESIPAGDPIVVIAPRNAEIPFSHASSGRPEIRVFAFSDSGEYARNLYSWFHDADDLGAGWILAGLPEPEGIGSAVRDRLRRASGQSTGP